MSSSDDTDNDTGHDTESDSETAIDTATLPMASDTTIDNTIGSTTLPVTSTTAPATATPRRRLDRGLLIASFVIACGVILIGWALTTAVTGDDGIDRPEAIESVQPVEDAVQVLQQERVVVDLQSGYEATLVIDGIELPTTIIGQSDVDPQAQATPGQQVDLPTTAVFDPGNAVIAFQPVEGAPIESFEQGTHEARVIFWKTEDGPDTARSYRWEFEVV